MIEIIFLHVTGIGCGKSNLENCIAMASNRVHLHQWKTCKHLIIDEISMIDSELFDKIEAVARALRKSDRPFGGIQLIVCGDFLQLPPVIKTGEKKKFCFQVRVLFGYSVLTEVFPPSLC